MGGRLDLWPRFCQQRLQQRAPLVEMRTQVPEPPGQRRRAERPDGLPRGRQPAQRAADVVPVGLQPVKVGNLPRSGQVRRCLGGQAVHVAGVPVPALVVLAAGGELF
jgi:hypothetical protein